MTLSKMLLPALAASVLLASAAVPASAVAISQTNRAAGDPAEARMPAANGVSRPGNTSSAEGRFDKRHHDTLDR